VAENTASYLKVTSWASQKSGLNENWILRISIVESILWGVVSVNDGFVTPGNEGRLP
jgi:hypothetical protein